MKLKKRLKGVSDVGRGRPSIHMHTKLKVVKPAKDAERLVSVAIIRGDDIHHGFKSHWELRASLGDEEPGKRLRGDYEGFWTDKDRFVSREAAGRLAAASGQASPYWANGGREFLSSDVNQW